MEKQILRNLNTLYISGTAVLLFGVWSLVKTLAQLAYGNVFTEEQLLTMQEIPYLKLVTTMILLVMLAVDLLLRLYVGFTARRIGKGLKKNGAAYLVLAFLMLLLSATGIVSYLLSMNQGELTEQIMGMIVEVTSFCSLLELILSGSRARKLQKHAG